MTEQEWLVSADPAAMLEHLQRRPQPWASAWKPPSERKLRLFACASLAVSHCGIWTEAKILSTSEIDFSVSVLPHLLRCDWHCGIDLSENAALLRDIFGSPWQTLPICWWCLGDGQASHDEEKGLCTVCGGTGHALARSVIIWNDGIIPRLARTIYDSRNFSDMLILADALEEAGCHNEDILRHCRGWERILLHPNSYEPDPEHHMLRLRECWHRKTPCQHVRGCWAIDCILGKE